LFNAPNTIVQRNINGVIKANTTTQPLGSSNGSLASTSFVNQTVNASLVPIQNGIRNLSEDSVRTNAFLSGSINTLEGQVTTLEGQVTPLQGQVTPLQGQVTTLEDQVTTLENRFNDSLTSQSDLNTSMESLFQILDDKVETNKNVQLELNETFTSRIDELDTRIALAIPNLENQVGTKQGGVSRFYMSNTIPDNNSGILGDMVFVYDANDTNIGVLYVCVQSNDPTADTPLDAVWLKSNFSS
jgi:uncharacterized coiled-coil protein SlyX